MEDDILQLFKDCAEVVEEGLRGRDISSLHEKVGMGADGTATSRLDSIAEEIALEHIKNNSPYGILSEESGYISGEENGVIIMDPIDGTSNALSGIPFYSISLAFTTGDLSDTTVGYVKELPLGKEYYTIKGRGSFIKESGGKSEKIPKLPSNKELNFSVYMGQKAHPDSVRIAALARRTRSLGCASLEMCMVAEGIFDLYYIVTMNKERSLRITDIAASTLFLREVGGEVYQSVWEPLEMELDPGARRDVLAIRDQELRELIY